MELDVLQCVGCLWLSVAIAAAEARLFARSKFASVDSHGDGCYFCPEEH